MKKVFYVFALICSLTVASNQSYGQCPYYRYLNEIFPAYTDTTVTYSTPYSLQMDIYQPAGDTFLVRPLIILAHGGSFVGGTRSDDSTVVWMCRNFSRRGYVVASIDYRLGNILGMLDSATATDYVIKAISDGKAAVRYFVKNAASGNSFRVDTNNIFIGGNSAGAVLYMHVGYLDSLGEAPGYIQAAMAANGGFEGNSGNAGYTTRSRGVINLAGALNMVSFVSPGDKPSVNAQGDADLVVPYTCGHPNIGVTVPVTLCGLGSLEPAYVSNSIYHMSHVFPGDSHVPWASDPVKFNTVDSLVTQFLYSLVCYTISDVNTVAAQTETKIFPNPATSVVNIRAGSAIRSVSVYDQTGRVVLAQDGVNSENLELNTERLMPGMYFVRMSFIDGNSAPIVKSVVIE